MRAKERGVPRLAIPSVSNSMSSSFSPAHSHGANSASTSMADRTISRSRARRSTSKVGRNTTSCRTSSMGTACSRRQAKSNVVASASVRPSTCVPYERVVVSGSRKPAEPTKWACSTRCARPSTPRGSWRQPAPTTIVAATSAQPSISCTIACMAGPYGICTGAPGAAVPDATMRPQAAARSRSPSRSGPCVSRTIKPAQGTTTWPPLPTSAASMRGAA